MVNSNPGFWKGRSVFITGHTGFKGSWLALWLHKLGANIHGYALQPPSNPALFTELKIDGLLKSDTRADLADFACLQSVMQQHQPEIVFHLAAQSLVRKGYQDPLGTMSTNVMGTANVLEAARSVHSIKSIVVITTDKVYENHEDGRPYSESDNLGGYDPYSASKAAAEIVAASFRSSYFGSKNEHKANIATARAGNVIGGGDWADDRLVPDCLRAFAKGETVHLRFPMSVRPWQHVLESLSGYLLLAEHLFSAGGEKYAKAWNFGPHIGNEATVGNVAQMIATIWGDGARVEIAASDDDFHEAGLLHLDSSAAISALEWQPHWTINQALENTVAWQKAWLGKKDMQYFTLEQINSYEIKGAI